MAAKGLLSRRLSLALLPLLLAAAWAGESLKHRRQSDGDASGCGARGRFQVNGDTIIRTQDSRLLGAHYLNETELPTQRQCLAWCCRTPSCNVAVFEQKDKGSCYLFDCGPSTDFKCKFTAHHDYSSAILDTSPQSDGSAPNGGGASKGYSPPHSDEHIAALKNLKKQVQPVATEGQNPGETETISKPGPTTAASTTVVADPLETPKPSAVPPGNQNSLAGGCTHFQFQCRRSGECIAVYNACDGIPQCSDGSDEGEDLGCPTDGRRHLGLPPSSSSQEKSSFSDNVPLTSGQADKPRPAQNGASPHRSVAVGDPAPQRSANVHAAKSGHRGQKPETQVAPISNPSQSSNDHSKFDGSYISKQEAVLSPDTGHYVDPSGHQSGFSGAGDSHPKESGAPPSRYDHAYPKTGSPLKPAPEAHLQLPAFHRQHSSGGDSLGEDPLEPNADAWQSFDKGRSPEANHQILGSDDGSRLYYQSPPQYDAAHQENPDTSLSETSGQYASDRTNGGYAREYYEGGYAPSNTDYAQKGGHYQQQESQYAAHEPLYGHHPSDIHQQSQSKNHNWPSHQPYDDRNTDNLDQGPGPNRQGAYADHRYPVEQQRPVSELDIPVDHPLGGQVGGHGQGGRQDYGHDQLYQPILDHEKNLGKYWPQAANHNPGPQPSSKKANQETGGLLASLHPKQVPVHDISLDTASERHTPNTEGPKSAEETKGHPAPPPVTHGPSRSDETKAVSKTMVKPQHRLSHVELNLAEVEVTKAERTSESSGAILALTLGLSITGLMLVLVGCRLRMVRRRLRRGRSPYAHDADYLVNGMYL